VNIFITGGAGYIGSHTCVELLNEGFDIVVADNLSNSSQVSLDRVRRITGRDFPFYEIDICDEDALSRVFEEHSFDGVIHFAGLKAVGESVSRPVTYYSNNLISTLTLCRVMQRYLVHKIVYSSSATVYSPDNPLPLREESKLGCTNPYGWSKYMCEQILRDVAAADRRWSALLLRYFNPVGVHPSGLIGEDPRDIPNNLMPFITQVAVGRREKLHIFGGDYDTPDGTGIRDYIHVVDLAKGHVAAIKYLQGFTGVDAINLGTGRGFSVLEMVSTFEKTNGVNIPYEIVGRRAGDVACCYADPQKANRLLHWRAEKTLEDMCRDSWRWQYNNPHGYGRDDGGNVTLH